MKTKHITYLVLGAAAALGLASCNHTWLMYDSGQKPKLYFEDALQTRTRSFALLSEDTIRVETTVHVMGDPEDHDRTYSVVYTSPAPGDTLAQGSVSYPVVEGVYGEDFTLDDLVIPAGQVTGTLGLTLHRTPKMLDSCLVRIGLRLASNDEFDPCAPDSSSTSKILTPDFVVYVNDGEPACPFWWRNATNSPLGWHYDLGNFSPMKYRKMLELFHATEKTNPAFFNHNVDLFGYYLDTPNPEKLTANQMKMTAFWRQSYAYSSSWAVLVFKPLRDYFVEYYAAHPDDPYWEDMDLPVNIRSRVGWGDPITGTYAFFN